MNGPISPLTLRVTAFGVHAADVADDALTQGRDFFGEDAEIEIVSGEIQRVEGPTVGYSGSVVICQIGRRATVRQLGH